MKFLQFLLFISCFLIESQLYAQLNNNCSNAIQVCNNQLAEQLDDGPGTQECPTGGCGCMLAGEKNTGGLRLLFKSVAPWNLLSALTTVRRIMISPYGIWVWQELALPARH